MYMHVLHCNYKFAILSFFGTCLVWDKVSGKSCYEYLPKGIWGRF